MSFYGQGWPAQLTWAPARRPARQPEIRPFALPRAFSASWACKRRHRVDRRWRESDRQSFSSELEDTFIAEFIAKQFLAPNLFMQSQPTKDYLKNPSSLTSLAGTGSACSSCKSGSYTTAQGFPFLDFPVLVQFWSDRSCWFKCVSCVLCLEYLNKLFIFFQYNRSDFLCWCWVPNGFLRLPW